MDAPLQGNHTPSGGRQPQTPYQHQPYVPQATTGDSPAPPSGYSGSWYRTAATVAEPLAAPMAPVAPPPFWGPAHEGRPGHHRASHNHHFGVRGRRCLCPRSHASRLTQRSCPRLSEPGKPRCPVEDSVQCGRRSARPKSHSRSAGESARSPTPFRARVQLLGRLAPARHFAIVGGPHGHIPDLGRPLHTGVQRRGWGRSPPARRVELCDVGALVCLQPRAPDS